MGRRCVRKRIGMAAEVVVVGVAEVGGGEGVRTRARALAIAAAEAREKKRTRIRKVGGGVADQLRSTSSYNRTRLRGGGGGGTAASEESSSSVGRSCVEEANCWSEGGVVCEDDHDEATATAAAAAGSCCSSSSAPNARRPPVDAPLPIQDPENDDGDDGDDVDEAHVLGTNPMNFNCRKRRRITPSTEFEAESAGMEPAATLPSADPNDSQHRGTAQRMLSEDSEIEEFFAAAEKDLHQRFRDKYNYDVVKDVPLHGRYKWVPVNP